MKKKIGSWKGILIGAAMIGLLGGCGAKEKGAGAVLEPGQSDLEYVQSKGTLLIGVTDFPPVDYKEGDSWGGFDAELARAFAERLGVEPEFVEIDWDDKIKLLEDGTIDCIWNNMTLTEELQETISCSEPYLSNSQVVVLRTDGSDRYEKVEDCQHLLFAAEAGSTGESVLEEKNYRYTTYDSQREALQSVSDKQSDAAVIDVIMAGYFTGEGHEFEDLCFRFPLNDEAGVVGFRKGSDLTERGNEFLKDCLEDGTMETLAEQYGMEQAILN